MSLFPFTRKETNANNVTIYVLVKKCFINPSMFTKNCKMFKL